MEVEQKPFTQKKPDQLVYLELAEQNAAQHLRISAPCRKFVASMGRCRSHFRWTASNASKAPAKSNGWKMTVRAAACVSPTSHLNFALCCKGGSLAVLPALLRIGKLFRARLLRSIPWRKSARNCDPGIQNRHDVRREQPEPPKPAPETKAVAATLPLECKPEPVVPVVTESPAGHKEFSSVKRLFPLPAGPLPAKPETPKFKAPKPEPAFSQAVKTSATSSAFLKVARPASPEPVAPTIPSPSIPEAPIDSVPPLSIPTTLIPPVSAPREPRLVVPPLEDSFELGNAPKLSLLEESPRLSRAAAASIIAIAAS
jgi:hypothetical protein